MQPGPVHREREAKQFGSYLEESQRAKVLMVCYAMYDRALLGCDSFFDLGRFGWICLFSRRTGRSGDTLRSLYGAGVALPLPSQANSSRLRPATAR